MEENWYEKLNEEINNLTDEQREEFKRQLEETHKYSEASYYSSLLRYNRAFKQDRDCREYGDGEYHVYMWLHADGTPFYVGMGKGDRWKQASGRNERFYEETKQLDTLVCKLVDGLTSQEAREAEFCLSHYLTYNGYKLANWDNNYHRCIDEKQADRRVGKYVRLMKKSHNYLTVKCAKSKMTTYKIPYDYNLMYKVYTSHYGTPT